MEFQLYHGAMEKCWCRMPPACPDTFAPSYPAKASSGPGLVAASAEDKKKVQTQLPRAPQLYMPMSIETSWCMWSPVPQLSGRPKATALSGYHNASTAVSTKTLKLKIPTPLMLQKYKILQKELRNVN